MIQEEKQLLLKDLCARLPYHVRCKVWLKDGTTEEGPLDLQHNYGDVLQDAFYYSKIKDIKPYLRPMSSMTEEEKHEVMILWNEDFTSKESLYHCYPRTTDFYNRHHLDYLGLIEKGLAIEVTKENNPYKE